ncbi:MAG: hypothetical protein EOO06_08225 [Chitinophagaceae bacterium]|nr:MAG: hypothetical protein EOO06_08225 [Chitinophagaceae bacterium]
MKKLLLIPICFITVVSFAQFNLPASVVQRLGNDRSFDRFAYENMRQVTNSRIAAGTDPARQRYFNKQEKFLARTLWYLEGRQDSAGNIFNYAKKTLEESERYADATANAIESTNGSWTLVGPTNNQPSTNNASKGQGRVDRFAFHPTDANIVFAGTPCGGLWKSMDKGTTWSAVNTHIPNLSVSGIVINWQDPNDIYVLTGDGDSNGGDNYFVQGFDYIRPSIGVIKSTDGGITWRRTGDLGISGFYTGYKLIQSPTNPSLLIAATSEGLYRTTNGGGSWELVSPNTDRYFDVEWKPGSSLRVYAASHQNFYISLNAGGSFSNQDDNFDFPVGTATRMAIAVTPDNVNCVYVFAGYSTDSYDNNIGVYKSTDGGDNFIRKTSVDNLVSSARYMHNIAVSSINENVVITGSLELWKSTDGGVNFSLMSSGGDASATNFAHADVHDIAFNPLDNTLYIGTDGGVHRSSNSGTNLVACYNMSNTQFYHFDVSESNTDYMMGGAQDNGTMLRTGNSSIFYHFTGGDGYDIQFLHGAQSPAYFSVNKNLFKSNILFAGHTQMEGINESWYKPIAVSYFNNDIAYTSSDTVFKTTNGGDSWTSKSANGRWALVTCPSNSNRIYAAGGASWNDGGSQSEKTLKRSDNGGDSWINLRTSPGFPSNITKITSIGVSPSNSARVWVTMGGFTDNQKVYYSSNSGGDWLNITGSLPNIPVNCIAVDENADAYIGTDIGVFFRSATMTDWQPFYNLMPRIPVTELHIRGSVIYASTFGRGIWRSSTYTECPAELSLVANLTGYRFYEAAEITTSSVLSGGISTEVFMQARTSVTMLPGFSADATTGEKFKAWIANCGTGGIPVFDRTIDAGFSRADGQLKFEMPFDGKASVLVLDNNQQLKHIISLNEVYRKGRVELNSSLTASLTGTVVLVIDGQLGGTIVL